MWMPLPLVVVIALGGYAVVWIRDLFGANPVAVVGDEKGDGTAPFSPKHITYEITGHPAAAPTLIIQAVLISVGRRSLDSLPCTPRPRLRRRQSCSRRR